jgi:hypothetical protein
LDGSIVDVALPLIPYTCSVVPFVGRADSVDCVADTDWEIEDEAFAVGVADVI